MTDPFTLENVVLALQSNADFVLFMQALEKARDDYYRSDVLGLHPTADALEVQRKLGHLEGLDELCGAPAAILKAANRKRNPPPRQVYAGRPTDTYSTDEEDDN